MGNAKNLKDYHVEIKLIHPTKKLEKKKNGKNEKDIERLRVRPIIN